MIKGHGEYLEINRGGYRVHGIRFPPCNDGPEGSTGR